MTSDQDTIRFQSEQHPLAWMDGFTTNEEYCAYLIHLRAYLEAAELARDRVVLDLGCNTGYGTSVIGRGARRVVGADVSGRAIEEATRTYGTRNVEFQVIDGRRLPFESRSFDLVTGLQVIEHISDLPAFLAEISRVLSDQGKAVFTTPNALLRLDPGMKPWNPFHVREFSPGDLRATLEPWFQSVRISGLFGAAELYETELHRVLASRENARRRAKLAWRMRVALRKLLKKMLPEAVVQRLRETAMTRNAPDSAGKPSVMATPEIPTFASRYTPTDLFYRDDGIEEALDLMAICATT